MKLSTRRSSSSRDELHEYFRDVHDHLRRVETRIAGFRDLLGSALQANLTQVGWL